MNAVGSFHPAIARRCRADGHLKAQLDALGGEAGLLIWHEQRAWASITFSGTRHRLEYAFEGGDAVERGRAMLDALPEHEFRIPGQLVADAAVIERREELEGPARLEAAIEVLLLEEN
ncbi:conserved hypothetical protein [Altererythrobacter sp. B11]|uniref:hypothetical protein n=1 Tax=Altererythrobacter sp. B11 TaxID=2060312 RepID=UPI000DC72710|nr:hypothetical protein [Altererythrobacter sp. B11]BBC72908.1 conserved hypothetical protein [Altererythrobacter sp. B11]